MENRYRKYSEAMIQKFGKKVYKIPINLPLTCPNRDGRIAVGGCTFCGEIGAGFECLDSEVNVAEQFNQNAAYIGKKYKADGFIAFLQNYSNTYMPPETLDRYLGMLPAEKMLGLSISTRPDCVAPAYMEVLKEYQEKYQWHITVEYGLQTVNYRTLETINRGHGLAEFIEAVLLNKRYGFETCAHLILNLPGDEDIDTDEAAAILGALEVEQVKLHSLYILKNTPMGDAYLKGDIAMISPEAYVDRVVSFIRKSRESLIFQRLAGRAPAEETLFCNWGMSWWKLADMIDNRLEELDARQGDLGTRLGGRGVRQWL